MEERLALAPLLVTNTTDNEFGSLRWAVEQANTAPEADTIRFDPSVFSTAQTITLTTGQLRLTGLNAKTTIEGPGQELLTISGNRSGRVFRIDPAVEVEIRDLRIADGIARYQDGFHPYEGGGILNRGDLTLNRVTVSGNSAYYGCGLANYDATANIIDSTFTDNHNFPEVNALGLGIYNSQSILTISNSTFTENTGNTGGTTGGGLYNTNNAQAIITGATFSRNSVLGSGAGLLNGGGSTVTVTDSAFVENQGGGGLFNGQGGSGTAIISNSSFIGNAGGGGLVNGGEVIIRDVIFSQNSSPQKGGGMSSFYGATSTIERSTFAGNSALYGGGFYTAYNANTTIINSTFSGNTAFYSGGGIWMGDYPGALTLANSTLFGNRASAFSAGVGSGGGLYIGDGAPELTNTLVAGNLHFVGNPGSPGPWVSDDIHGTVGGSYNLIGHGFGMTGLTDGQQGNQVGSSSNPLDARLAPLANNGGSTPTHALLPNSPALDRGDPAFDPNDFTPPLTVDQRGDGYPRIIGSAVDIGAFEDQGGPELVIQNLGVEPSAIHEGEWVTLSGEFAVDAPQLTYAVTIEWGDGAVSNFGLAQNDRSFAMDHHYLDNPAGGLGSFTARVTILAGQQMDIRTVPVPVANMPPTIDTANVPTTLSPGIAAQFSATASDAGEDTLLFQWSFGDPWSGEGGWAEGPDVSHAYTQAGTYPVTLMVYDDDWAWDYREWMVVVADNLPPTADPGGPYVVDVGSNLPLDGTASSDPNPGDQIVTYEWDVDNDGAFDDATSATPTIPWSVLAGLPQPGIANPIHLRVTDPVGATGTASTTLSIYDNRPFADFTATPNPAAPWQNITFDASGSSHGRSDRGLVSYQWDLDNDGQFDDVAGVSISHTFGQFGSYTVALQVTDDNVPAKTATASLVVMVNQGNQPPLADPGGPYLADLGQGLTLDGSDSSDPNQSAGDSIVSYQWDLADNGSYEYTGVSPTIPAAALAGFALGQPIPIRLQVTDTFGTTGEDLTSITVYDNTPPVANDDTYVADEDTTLSVLAPGVLGNDSFVDGDSLTAVLVTDVAHGTLVLTSDGSFTYTPDADYHGSDSFTYQVSGGDADSNLATVQITVIPVKDVVDDAATANEDSSVSLDVMNNDTFDDLTAHLVGVTCGSNGSVIIQSVGTVTYIPDPDFHGRDTFTYTVQSGGVSETGTVSVVVLSVQEQADSIISDVQNLVESGLLDSKDADKLTKRIEKAKERLNRGENDKAVNELEAFVKDVEKLVEKHELPEMEGQRLEEAAKASIAAAAVTVPQQLAQVLIDNVAGLVPELLSPKDAAKLVEKLEKAIIEFDKLRVSHAIDVVESFANEVENLVIKGRLAADIGQQLNEAAGQIIASALPGELLRTPVTAAGMHAAYTTPTPRDPLAIVAQATAALARRVPQSATDTECGIPLFEWLNIKPTDTSSPTPHRSIEARAVDQIFAKLGGKCNRLAQSWHMDRITAAVKEGLQVIDDDDLRKWNYRILPRST